MLWALGLGLGLRLGVRGLQNRKGKKQPGYNGISLLRKQFDKRVLAAPQIDSTLVGRNLKLKEGPIAAVHCITHGLFGFATNVRTSLHD